MKVTLSVIKADIGGYVGRSEPQPDVLTRAKKAKKEGLPVDYCVAKCGDDLHLIMTHECGEEDEKAIFRLGRVVEAEIPKWIASSPFLYVVCFLIVCLGLGVIILAVAGLLKVII
jgi:fructose 1,6-bisphosphatase